MKILILNLPKYGKYSVTREGRCEYCSSFRVDTPISLLIIATLLKKRNHQITFIDANGASLGYDFVSEKISVGKFNCVIFSFNSRILEYDLKICKIIKNQSPSTVTIGYSWYGKEFSKEILREFNNLDIQILDDPFSIIEDLIDCLNDKRNLSSIEGIAFRENNDEIIINPKIKNTKNFNDLPIPAYEFLSTYKPYFIYSKFFLKPYSLVYAGKGCPFSCKYCIVSKTKYSGRSAENVIRDLKILKKVGKIKYIWFFDEVFTINRRRVIEICNGIMREKLNIKWFCDTRVDLVDQELLKIMKKGGCIGIAYGVESGSQKILDSMSKGITVEQAKTALKWTRKANIPIQLNLILGYIGENEKTIKETKAFVKEILPNILQIAVIHAKYGTEFTKIALKNKWLDNDINWRNWLKIQSLDPNKYQPFQYDLYKEIKKIYKINYLNPKWLIISILSLIKNYSLILPAIEYFFFQLSKIRTIYSIKATKQS